MNIVVVEQVQSTMAVKNIAKATPLATSKLIVSTYNYFGKSYFNRLLHIDIMSSF